MLLRELENSGQGVEVGMDGGEKFAVGKLPVMACVRLFPFIFVEEMSQRAKMRCEGYPIRTTIEEINGVISTFLASPDLREEVASWIVLMGYDVSDESLKEAQVVACDALRVWIWEHLIRRGFMEGIRPFIVIDSPVVPRRLSDHSRASSREW